MILIILLAGLCFTVSFGIGSALLRKFLSVFNDENQFTIVDEVLAGVCVLMIWCNTWSIFFPVDYKAILLPLFVSIFFIWKLRLKLSLTLTASSFFLMLFPLVLYLLFAVVPPFHGDSEGYHFTAIRWIESYKVIPGLANIHGRLGFNSSYFPLSAAFSFSSFFDQPIYPVNFLLTVLFEFWMSKKILEINNGYQKLLFFVVLVYSFRWQLINLSSPSPDSFPAIVVLLVMLEFTFIVYNKKQLQQSWLLFIFLLALSAFTVKLSCLPIFLVIGVMLFANGRTIDRRLVAAFCLMIVVTCLPWFIRSVITSGYLIYPLHELDIFNFDWKAPIAFAKFDRLLIQTGPRMIEVNSLSESQKLSFFQWVPQWLKVQLNQPVMLQSLLLLVAAVSTIVAFIIRYRSIQLKEKLLWMCGLVSVVFWMYSSPDYRFGYPFLLSVFFIGFSWLPINMSKKVSWWLMVIVAVVFTIHYGKMGINMLPPESNFLIYPTSKRPIFKEVKTGFPAITLSNGSTLYVSDTANSCLDAGLPCTNMFYPGFDIGTIKARGATITDGFRVEEKH